MVAHDAITIDIHCWNRSFDVRNAPNKVFSYVLECVCNNCLTEGVVARGQESGGVERAVGLEPRDEEVQIRRELAG